MTVTIDRALSSAKGPDTRRRLVVIGDSGGQCGIAADQAAAIGLDLPTLGAPAQQGLTTLLTEGAATSNPVDLAGAGEADMENYTRTVACALSDPDVDVALLTGYFGCYGVDNSAQAADELATVTTLADAKTRTGKPVFVHTMDPSSSVARSLWEHGMPAFGTIEQALRAISGSAVYAAEPRQPVDVPTLPTTTPGSGYFFARSTLRNAGITFPEARVVRSAAEATAAAKELCEPLVLKAAWMDHKSDMGGVLLGISARDAGRAFENMHRTLGDGEYVLEEMDTRADAVEIIIGCRRDPDLGVTVTVGAGGVTTEVFADVTLEMAPVTTELAEEMIGRLRIHRLLAGWRGKPATDIAGLARTIATVSRVAACDPQIAEIELNPVRVAPQGVVAVDALLVTTSSSHNSITKGSTR